MAKTRSPEYPAVSLKEAVDRVKLIYEKDYQNRLPKRVIAEHMGYKSLSGASLPVLAALGKYGLLEGRGDETRVSDLAVKLIAHAPGTPERIEALKAAASTPELFAELDSRFADGKASDQAIRSYLLINKFIPTAADSVIRSYRETKQFVEAESAGYNPAPEPEPVMSSQPQSIVPEVKRVMAYRGGNPPAPMRTAVFPLSEGDVTLTFPPGLSPDACEELRGYIEMFLKGMKRAAEDIRRAELEFAPKDEAAN